LIRVGFAGTPPFAAAALVAILDAGFPVPIVLTRPDRPRGRGLKVLPSAVKDIAHQRGLAVLDPPTLTTAGSRAAVLAIPLDVLVVAAYGLLLPPEILAWPVRGCVNIHASLLPRWRGAAPIERAILEGDAETGISLMQMDAGLDTGDMLLAERVAIGPDDTTGSLHDQLAALGGRLVVEALELAACGGLKRAPQPAEGVTYANKIEKSESPIDWAQPAQVIARRVRAFNPAPGATAVLGGETIKVWRAHALDGRGSVAPGTVVAIDGRGIGVACGDGGRLEIVELQRAGGKRLAAADFLRGFPLEPGSRFEPAA